MNVLKFILRRKIVILLFSIFIIMMGTYAAIDLNKELMPPIDFDGAFIRVVTGDLKPYDVEQLVVKPLEQRLLGINGIESLDTTIITGGASMFISFESGRMDELFREVESVVNIVQPQLPGVQQILAQKFSTSQPYEFFMDISNGDMEVMSAFAQDIVKPRMEALPEVREVSLAGVIENEILIELQMDKLLEHGIDISMVIASIQSTNTDASLGQFNAEENSPILRWDTSFKNINDIKNIPISTMDGVVALETVAEIDIQPKDMHSALWKDGTDQLIFVQIGRVSGVSQIDMARAVRQEIEILREENLIQGFEFNEIVAQADYVEEAIFGVTNNLIIGALIAFVILFMFLRNVRATLIIGISIPSSILLTFSMMWMFGYSFNMITLIALGLGIGMMVDSSIVILESIYRKKEEGLVGLDAAVVGIKEVATPVIASMLTTIVVFVPVSLIGGEIGQFVIVLSTVIAVALMSSVLVAFTVIPAIAENFLRLKENRKSKESSKFITGYGRVIAWMASKKRYRLAIIGLFTIVLLSSMLLITKIPTIVMPDFLNRYAEMGVNLEPGISTEDRHAIIDAVSQEVSVIQDVDTVYIMDNGNTLFLIVNMTKDDDITRNQSLVNEDILSTLRTLSEDLPIVEVANAMFGSAGSPVQILIKGDSFEELGKLADKVIDEISQIEGLVGIVNTNQRQSEQQLIVLHEESMRQDGITSEQMKQFIRMISMELPVGEIISEGELLPLKLTTNDNLTTKADFLDMKILTQQGFMNLSKYISLETVETPNQILRKDGERTISIQSDIESRDLGSINRDIQKALDKVDIPRGYSISIAGDLEAQADAMKELLMVLIISIFLVYVVMAIQFNSLVHPLVIMSIIPMTIVGVILGLFITQFELSMLSGMGIIILIGIVLNNAILLLDRTKQLRITGSQIDEAIKEACKNRIRPILMTTLTTSGGMLPLALASGVSGNYQAPLATVIISGLLFATVITLILIPAVYMIFNDIGIGVKRVFNKKIKQEEILTNEQVQ